MVRYSLNIQVLFGYCHIISEACRRRRKVKVQFMKFWLASGPLELFLFKTGRFCLDGVFGGVFSCFVELICSSLTLIGSCLTFIFSILTFFSSCLIFRSSCLIFLSSCFIFLFLFNFPLFLFDFLQFQCPQSLGV